MKIILLEQNSYVVKLISEIFWWIQVSLISRKNPVAFPHGLSLLQNTGTIILLALPARNTATLSPSTAAPPGSFTAKHLGMIPEDVEE